MRTKFFTISHLILYLAIIMSNIKLLLAVQNDSVIVGKIVTSSQSNQVPTTGRGTFYSITYTVTQYYEWMYNYHFNQTDVSATESAASASFQTTSTPLLHPEEAAPQTTPSEKIEETTQKDAKTKSIPLPMITTKRAITSKSNTPSNKKELTKSKTKNQNRVPPTTKSRIHPTERIITNGELIASITSAAQAGVLGTLLVCLTVLGVLCSKGVLSFNLANGSLIHPMPSQPPSSVDAQAKPKHNNKRTQRRAGVAKSTHRISHVQKTKNLIETKSRQPTTKQVQTPRKKVKTKRTNLKATRELTWKSRTCFTVDETEPPNKKENVLLKILNKSTSDKPIQENKRGQTYLKSPSVVEITVS